MGLSLSPSTADNFVGVVDLEDKDTTSESLIFRLRVPFGDTFKEVEFEFNLQEDEPNSIVEEMNEAEELVFMRPYAQEIVDSISPVVEVARRIAHEKAAAKLASQQREEKSTAGAPDLSRPFSIVLSSEQSKNDHLGREGCSHLNPHQQDAVLERYGNSPLSEMVIEKVLATATAGAGGIYGDRALACLSNAAEDRLQKSSLSSSPQKTLSTATATATAVSNKGKGVGTGVTTGTVPNNDRNSASRSSNNTPTDASPVPDVLRTTSTDQGLQQQAQKYPPQGGRIPPGSFRSNSTSSLFVDQQPSVMNSNRSNSTGSGNEGGSVGGNVNANLTSSSSSGNSDVSSGGGGGRVAFTRGDSFDTSRPLMGTGEGSKCGSPSNPSPPLPFGDFDQPDDEGEGTNSALYGDVKPNSSSSGAGDGATAEDLVLYNQIIAKFNEGVAKVEKDYNYVSGNLQAQGEKLVEGYRREVDRAVKRKDDLTKQLHAMEDKYKVGVESKICGLFICPDMLPLFCWILTCRRECWIWKIGAKNSTKRTCAPTTLTNTAFIRVVFKTKVVMKTLSSSLCPILRLRQGQCLMEMVMLV